MYATVLREAASEDDLHRFVNAKLLVKHWAELQLPELVQRAWESHHVELQSYGEPVDLED